jgi:hypothetical protein
MWVRSYFISVLLLFSSAFAQDIPARAPQEEYLRGWITPDSLYSAAPEFRPVPGAYRPAEEALQLLRHYDEPLTILTFFGNWCSDSKREVPRSFAVLNLANNQNFSIKLFGLDRSKKDEGGFAEAFDVTRVPTFIFLRGERDFSANGHAASEQIAGELGRIVETPAASIEQDWVDILKNNSAWRAKLEWERQLVLWLISIALIH